jgi:hypothetical protein
MAITGTSRGVLAWCWASAVCLGGRGVVFARPSRCPTADRLSHARRHLHFQVLARAAGIEPAAHHTTWVTTPDRTCRIPARTCRIPDNLMVCIEFRPGRNADTGHIWTNLDKTCQTPDTKPPQNCPKGNGAPLAGLAEESGTTIMSNGSEDGGRSWALPVR